MKAFIPAVLASAMVLAAPAAQAENWYVDGGYSFVNIDIDTYAGSADIDLGAVGGQMGLISAHISAQKPKSSPVSRMKKPVPKVSRLRLA